MKKIKARNNRVLIGASIALSIFLVSHLAQAKTKSEYGFTHYEGYHKGLEAAKSANKPILLDFYFDT